MKRRLVITTLLFGLCAMASFAMAAEQEGQADLAALSGTAWTLLELQKEGEAEELKIPEQRPYLEFSEGRDASSLSMSGFAGCNHFQGRLAEKEGSLAAGPLMASRMFCENMEFENEFLQRLERVVAFTLQEDRLGLFGKDGLLVVLERKTTH